MILPLPDRFHAQQPRIAVHTRTRTNRNVPIYLEKDTTRRTEEQHMLTLDELKKRPSISIDEAAEILGIGRTSAYSAARKGEIPTIRVGARLRVLTAPLLRLLEADGAERVGADR